MCGDKSDDCNHNKQNHRDSDRKRRSSERGDQSRSSHRSRSYERHSRRSRRSRSRSKERQSRRRRDSYSRSKSRSRSHSRSRSRKKKESKFSSTGSGPNLLLTGANPNSVGLLQSPFSPVMPILAADHAATKMQRELFIGNTPSGTSEPALQAFLNSAMQQVHMNTMPGNPIIQTRVSSKYAFVELRSIAETNNMLNLNGIPFMGISLRIGRPSKYTGPQTPAVTWQDLTGQSALGIVAPTTVVGDLNNKASRELFIGNTPIGLNVDDLKKFLGAAADEFGLTTQPGNPIVTVRLSDRFCFVELRSIEETNNLLNLNGIPFMGTCLRVGRPSKYNGPHVPSKTFTELVLSRPNVVPSKVVRLSNMVTMDDLLDDQIYREIGEDVEEECKSFGNVVSYEIPRNPPGHLGSDQAGVGCVFVEFSRVEEATRALKALNGRTFSGKIVCAEYFPQESYHRKKFTLSPQPKIHAKQVAPEAAKIQATEFLHDFLKFL